MYLEKKRIFASECLEKIDQEIQIAGWVQTVRAHGKIAFFDLRDRSGTIQIVATTEDTVRKTVRLNQQDVVSIAGVVKKREERYINKENALGAIEVEAQKITILSKAETVPFDMAGKDLHLELPTMLDHRSLTLRHPTVSAIFNVQAAILEGFRKMAEKFNCTEIVVPTIAKSSTEGGSEVFPIDYYGHKAYLTQSPQLYKQMMVPIFERIWTIAHAYRAEPSVTTRHLAETTQLDFEIGFIEFEGLLDMFEHVAIGMLKHAEEAAKETLKEIDAPPIGFEKIPRFTLSQAQDIISKAYKRDVRGEKDLSPQDEQDICAWVRKEYGSDLVTITHFPTAKRAFYTMPDPKNTEVSLSYDMLFRGIEIMSGSQRIHQYDKLVAAMESRGLDPKAFHMYLMAFQYGMPPEGGFSFGLERITMKMLNLANIREASLFPRDMERVDERFSQTTS